MKNNILRLVLLIGSAAAIAACSSTHPGASAAAKSAAGEGAGSAAYTQGLGQQGSFAGTTISYKLRAPYNQVYHFDFDKDVVHQADIRSINVQANYLLTHKNARVRLEGNTDSRGSREYNIGLGWRRARAVASLLKQQGVAAKQIVMISYGEEKPVAFGHTAQDYALNRRVELKYEAK